jgi:hypothetical protein
MPAKSSSHPGTSALAVLAALALAAAQPAAQNDKKQQDKLDQAQRAEAQALVAAVDDMAAGKPAPTALPFKWEQHHFVKAQAGKTYVPFTLSVAPGAVTAPGVGLYLRVARQGAAQPAAPPAEAKKDKDKEEKGDAAPTYPFEDLYLFDLPAAQEGQPQQVRRAFAVEPGEYDVYLAMKERPAPASGSAPAEGGPKIGVIKQAISVPDFSTSDLTTSSIITAERVEVLQTPVANERQADHPYTFGQMRIVPALENKFSKKGELSVIFWIYGAQVDQNTKKPDVTIDFKFYQKAADKETYFNKTDPQALNAQTLPPQFDLAAGHQLPGSLAVPLASFPEGDYRLEIEIQDKLASKKVTRDVAFTVLSQ